MNSITKNILFGLAFIVIVPILYIVITTSGYLLSSIIYSKQYDINTGCSYKSINICEYKDKIMCNLSNSFHIYAACFSVGFISYVLLIIIIYIMLIFVAAIYNATIRSRN